MDRLRGFEASRGIELELADDLGGADGASSSGRIRFWSDLQPGEAFGVLLDVLAHEMMRHSEGVERPSGTVRETEGAAVAHIVCEAIGLATGSAVANNIRIYDGESETLLASLDPIQLTASMMIEAIEQDPRQSGRPRTEGSITAEAVMTFPPRSVHSV